MSQNDSAEYEDMYDFDYLKDTSTDLTRPKAKPKAAPDNRVRLPPVLVGRNIAANQDAQVSRRQTLSATEAPIITIKDWHKERQKLKAPRQPQKEVSVQQATRHKTPSIGRSQEFEPRVYTPKLPQLRNFAPNQQKPTPVEANTRAVNGNLTYRVEDGPCGRAIYPDPRPTNLRNGLTDEQMTSDIGRFLCDGKADTAQSTLLATRQLEPYSQPRVCTSVFDINYLTPEEKAAAANFDLEKEFSTVAKTKDSVSLKEKLVIPKIPQPPSTPKPVENASLPRRRRVRYKEDIPNMEKKEIPTPPKSETPSRRPTHLVRFTENTELNQDVSVHNESRPFYRPRPNTPFMCDYENEVKEATLMNERLQKANQLLHKGNTKEAFNEDDFLAGLDDILQSPTSSPLDVRPTTAALANRNDVVATPTLPYLAMGPKQHAEPMSTWNGDVARRGVGFKSKLKNNHDGQDKLKGGNYEMPENIKRQMKKYFH